MRLICFAALSRQSIRCHGHRKYGLHRLFDRRRHHHRREIGRHRPHGHIQRDRRQFDRCGLIAQAPPVWRPDYGGCQVRESGRARTKEVQSCVICCTAFSTINPASRPSNMVSSPLLIAVVIIVAVQLVYGTDLTATFNAIAANLTAAA